MNFAHPSLFFLLLVPFIIFAYLVLTNKEGIERVFSPEALKRIKVEGEGLSNRGRNVVFFIAIFFMIVAMSQPYIDRGDKNIKLSGLKMAVALDISGSMRSKDRYPNRLEFAKVKIKELLQQMPNNEVMLLTFADSVFLVSPLTSDIDTLDSVIDGIGDDYILNSSNFTALANVLKDKLSNMRDKIAIVVSDGGDKSELTQFEKIIKQNGITLYAILIGTKAGAPVLDKKGKAVVKNDQIVTTSVNEYLGKIAKESGGDFVIADYDTNGIKKIAREIETKFHATNSGKTVRITDRIELFYYPLIAGIIFLLSAFISVPEKLEFDFKFKRGKE